MPTNDDLQRQIVELRLRSDASADATAAILQRMVETEIRRQMDDRLPSEDEARFLRELLKRDVEHKRAKTDLMLHLAKMGTAGAVGFVLWAVWDRVKLALGKAG